MCMECEAFYRKPHIVSKTHNVSSNGSTVHCIAVSHYSSHSRNTVLQLWCDIILGHMFHALAAGLSINDDLDLSLDNIFLYTI